MTQPARQSLIRNFSIIAHIDHGKSTLADRFIQLCGGLEEREMQAQVLDNNPIERERGITIKAQAVSLNYKAKDGNVYQLNLIDTPGHVDFSYEVSRSLAACEGALLVVDASQGVEAQSVANCYTALEQKLEVMPILNKIDLHNAEPDRVAQEIEDIIGIEATDALRISAKTGLGVAEVLEALVHKLPAPRGIVDAPLQALRFTIMAVACLERKLTEYVFICSTNKECYNSMRWMTVKPLSTVICKTVSSEP